MASTDRDALRTLFRSTNGVEWAQRRNWDTDAELSIWYGSKGVKVNDAGRVVELSLRRNNLTGT